MRQLIEIASELQAVCDSKRWQSCVIGGLAVQRWGEPRLTRDVDVSLLTGFGTESAYIEALLALYEGRVTDPAAFALRTRVLLLQKAGIGIDIALAAIPFEERVLARSTTFEFLPGVGIRTCSAEDLIVRNTHRVRLHGRRGERIRHGEPLPWRLVAGDLFQKLRNLSEGQAQVA
jgi:hypothetical protein